MPAARGRKNQTISNPPDQTLVGHTNSKYKPVNKKCEACGLSQPPESFYTQTSAVSDVCSSCRGERKELARIRKERSDAYAFPKKTKQRALYAVNVECCDDFHPAQMGTELELKAIGNCSLELCLMTDGSFCFHLVQDGITVFHRFILLSSPAVAAPTADIYGNAVVFVFPNLTDLAWAETFVIHFVHMEAARKACQSLRLYMKNAREIT